MFANWRGSFAVGSIPIAGSADMRTRFDALTDHRTPSRSKWIAADSTPTKFVISPDNAAIGPPAAPLATVTIASRCSALARSSTITPADQLPFPISSGVKPMTMNPSPSSGICPNWPFSILKPMANVQEPLLGFAASWVRTHGQTKSQLHVS